ncbi:hypothetical protein GX865_03665 [Candidatus Saccharibacteria bacterium]|nr:hypothetical protein [Candidatus Saccharibacteria bacterium]
MSMRLLGGLAYFRATLIGRAKPHATMWLIWAITPFITFFAELSAGVGSAAVIPLALGTSPLLVALAALKVDRRLFKIDLFDTLCIGIALAGIATWAITSEPVTAIILAIAADTVSALPILRKTLRNPKSEYPPTYLLSALGMVVAILATEQISFAALAFPVYIFIINFLILTLTLRQYLNRYRVEPTP